MAEHDWLDGSRRGIQPVSKGVDGGTQPIVQHELRPLTTGEILDRTFFLYRSSFWLYVGLASIAAGSECPDVDCEVGVPPLEGNTGDLAECSSCRIGIFDCGWDCVFCDIQRNARGDGIRRLFDLSWRAYFHEQGFRCGEGTLAALLPDCSVAELERRVGLYLIDFSRL